MAHSLWISAWELEKVEIHQQQRCTDGILADHIVLVLGLSCAANTEFPRRDKLVLRIPLPTLSAVLLQTLAMGQICSYVLWMAINSVGLEA